MRKRKTLIKILGVFFAVAAVILLSFFVFVFRYGYVAPIIMYHRVHPEAVFSDRLSVKTQTFKRQMNFLKRHHYNVVSLEALALMIKEKQKIPPRTIAITFDDGYLDNFTEAFPVLKEYGLHATMFVIAGEIGAKNKFNLEEMKVMQESGLVDFGSHAVGPTPLLCIKSDEEIRYQIFESKRLLEEKLGKPVNLFSYPEGMFDAKIRQYVIDAGYTGAVATKAKRNYPSDDIFVLKRLRISENAGNMFVFAVETSGYYTFLREHKRQHKHGKK